MPAGNDELLSLFGHAAPAAPASDAAPRELLPDDEDILSLFKVGGDSASGALGPPGEIVPEPDPLRMFEPVTTPPSTEASPPPAKDDILAMFDAGDSPPSEFGAELPPPNDPLGMYDVPPQTPPFGEAPASSPQPRQDTGEPDILDMFGVVPAKPEGKEAK
jgi:hypothetical protein